MLQEDVDDFTSGGNPDGVNSRAQEVWGLRYIDDAMVRLLDKNLDGDCRDSGELFWQLNDAQFSVIAIVDKNAVLQERVSYTSYGVGTHRWPHEVNNTGGVTTSGSTSDYGVINTLASASGGAGTPINHNNYNVAADLNRDGVIDSIDTSIFTSTFGGAKSALASGLISDPNGPDNVFGYDGYVYNADQGLYTVRFRWYSPTFGRWLQRDPLGYVDGMNAMEYVGSRAIGWVDSRGKMRMQIEDAATDDPGTTTDSEAENDPMGLLLDAIDKGACIAQCALLGMTDSDLESTINELLTDPDLPAAARAIIRDELIRMSAQGMKSLGKFIALNKILQGRGCVGRPIYAMLKKALGKEVFAKLKRNVFRRWSVKILGKAATKIGGRFVPGANLALVGMDCYEMANCVEACRDGKYEDCEVPYIGLFMDSDKPKSNRTQDPDLMCGRRCGNKVW